MHRGDAVLAELVDQTGRPVADDDRVQRPRRARRAKVSASRETSPTPLVVGLDQDQDHRSHSQLLEQVDDGPGRLGSLAQHLHLAGRRLAAA